MDFEIADELGIGTNATFIGAILSIEPSTSGSFAVVTMINTTGETLVVKVWTEQLYSKLAVRNVVKVSAYITEYDNNNVKEKQYNVRPILLT